MMIPERRSNNNSNNNNNNSSSNVTRMMMTLLLLVVAVATSPTTAVVAAAAKGGEHPDGSVMEGTAATLSNNLRRAKGGDPPSNSKASTSEYLLQRILDEVEGLKERMKSLEADNESLRGGGNSPERQQVEPSARRSLEAGPTPVTMAQFNQYKKTVATQFATLNQSLQSTRALVDASNLEIGDKLGAVQADLRATAESVTVLTNKTEKNDQKTAELDSALQIVAGRTGKLETTTENFTTGLDQLSGRVAAGADTLSGAVTRLDATAQDVGDLSTRLACVDASSTATDLVFSGCNVHVRNGAGQTESTNGKGNLIVGYNEERGSRDRSGSHVIVVGPHHAWRGCGGIVAGVGHTQGAAFASAIGGSLNGAFGQGAVVVGGSTNFATGLGSVVVAGLLNHADGDQAMVAAGRENVLAGKLGLVAGGSQNTVVAVGSQTSVQDSTSVVLGGVSNIVRSSGNVVAGGLANDFPSSSSSVVHAVQVGGSLNTGSGLDENDVGIANTRFAD